MRVFAGLFLLLIMVSVASAQEISINGFVQTNCSARVTSTDNAPIEIPARDKDMISGEERVQLETITRIRIGECEYFKQD